MEWLLRIAQISFENIRTRLNTTALASNFIYDILLNIIAERRQWLVGNEWTIVRFIPACCYDKPLKREGRGPNEELVRYEFSFLLKRPWESGVRVTADAMRNRQKMRVLHEAMEIMVVGPPKKSKLKEFVV